MRTIITDSKQLSLQYVEVTNATFWLIFFHLYFMFTYKKYILLFFFSFVSLHLKFFSWMAS